MHSAPPSLSHRKRGVVPISEAAPCFLCPFSQEAARVVKDRVTLLNAKEAERLHQLELQKLKFKAELEAQMKANAYNR